MRAISSARADHSKMCTVEQSDSERCNKMAQAVTPDSTIVISTSLLYN